MVNKVEKIAVLSNYCLKLTFDDGLQKTIHVKPFIEKGFVSELLDPGKFKRVYIEEGGGIAWENGFDFCPIFLREMKEEEITV